MKAQELNGTHLGQAVQVQIGDATITDTIQGVEHDADLIDETRLCDNNTRHTLGRRRVRINFTRYGPVHVEPGAEIRLPRAKTETTDYPQSTTRSFT